jgi:hypothetical protein
MILGVFYWKDAMGATYIYIIEIDGTHDIPLLPKMPRQT